MSEHAEALGPVPTDAGGPGREETYWLRQKVDAAIRHLRDIEDYYRVKPSLHPQSFNAVRADRARQLYEAIIVDFREGKMTRPTRAERLAALAADNERLERERDELLDLLRGWVRQIGVISPKSNNALLVATMDTLRAALRDPQEPE